MCAGRYVALVSCMGVIKRTQPSKHHVYTLEVQWSDGVKLKVYRTYTAFFDFQSALREQAKHRNDCRLPELPGLKWFERGLLAKDGVMESKKKLIDEFCQKVLKLPVDIARGPTIGSFFSPWTSDLPEPDTSSKFYLNKQAGSLKISDPVAISMPQNHAMYKSLQGAGGDDASPSAADPPKHKPPSLKHTKAKSESAAAGDEPESEEWFLVQTEYKARRSGEVTLNLGNTVDVIQKDLSGWWFVYVEESQQEGWAPAASLEPINPRCHSPTDISANSGSLEIFKTLVDCPGNGKDEISYRAGEEVEVLEVNMDGWWLIQCNGQVGYTAATNLQQVSDVPTALRPKNGKTNARNLYHHHSIYKKSTPPPRRAASKKPDLYAQVDIAKKHKVKTDQQFEKIDSYSESEIDVTVPPEKGERSGPKLPCRSNTIQYAEVEFSEPENGSSKPFKRATSPTLYSEILPGASGKLEIQNEKHDALDQLIPRIKGDCYINVSPTNTKASYTNVTTFNSLEKEKKNENKFFRIMSDYTSNTAHSQGLDAMEGDIVMVQSSSGGRAFCIVCQKSHQPKTRPMEGFLPLELLTPFDPEIVDWTGSVPIIKDTPSMPTTLPGSNPTSMPEIPRHKALESKRSLPEETRSPSPSTPSGELAEELKAICSFASDNPGVASFEKGDTALKIKESPSGWLCVKLHQNIIWVPSEYWIPVQKTTTKVERNASAREALWFMGRMSRNDSEAMLITTGKQLDFIVRESTNRVGEFTLSVLYDGRVKHFPIEVTHEGKYFIGKHGFRDLSKVVSYYQRHPLFYDENNVAVSLGNAYRPESIC